MSGVNMLLNDLPAFSQGRGNEVRDLMERIYRGYCLKLEEKAGLRRKMQRKEVVSYGND
ncbi:hypothetical protein HYV85_04955 [Candidatus Woesearchaeota archaeon]|nr:hypothetical protein [Candidatus Woesearchaeota archaeon]